ncbi:CopD family protein [Kribbella shirazensis]|uniref:Putative copper export protein n=1 Tax=Kribbella shirazensis TaxID=1105143 RepID=A0A7X5VJY1_9ACTN|nr:CopD family protein [Kribbella shirazensis]NIK61493.1 putative copper export protein [Kribbella shirazensis]
MSNPAVARRDEILPAHPIEDEPFGSTSSHPMPSAAWARRVWLPVPWVATGLGCASIAVLAAARPAAPGAVADAPLIGLLSAVARVTGYVGLMLFVGTLAVWLLVWPSGRSDRRLIGLAGSGLLLVALSGLVGMSGILAGSATGSVDTSELASFTSVTDLLLQRPAAPLLARFAISAVGVVWLGNHVRSRVSGRGGVGHGTAAALTVLALILTVIAARPDPLSLTATTLTELHVLAAAGWVGGLAVLAVGVVPRRDPSALHATLGSFSWLSMASVLILAVTGTVHAFMHAGGLGPLIASAYGAALLAKLLAVAGMLLAATGSHHYVSRLRSRPCPVQVIALCIGAELALGVAALALTSTLVAAATRT